MRGENGLRGSPYGRRGTLRRVRIPACDLPRAGYPGHHRRFYAARHPGTPRNGGAVLSVGAVADSVSPRALLALRAVSSRAGDSAFAYGLSGRDLLRNRLSARQRPAGMRARVRRACGGDVPYLVPFEDLWDCLRRARQSERTTAVRRLRRCKISRRSTFHRHLHSRRHLRETRVLSLSSETPPRTPRGRFFRKGSALRAPKDVEMPCLRGKIRRFFYKDARGTSCAGI